MNRPTTILMTVLLTCACAWAQQDAPPATTDQPAAPTTQPAAGVEQLTVTVVSVEGKVYVRDASVEGGERKPLQAGDTLTERMVVITGFGSKAVLKFDEFGEVVVNSGTKMGIGAFRRSQGQVDSRVGMKYGTMKVSVDGSQEPVDFRVQTPTATAAAKGSGIFCAFGEFGFGIFGRAGSWALFGIGGSNTVQPGQQGDGNGTNPDALANLDNVNLGDPFGGLTFEEIMNLYLNGGGQGVFDFTGCGGTNPFFGNTPTGNHDNHHSPQGDSPTNGFDSPGYGISFGLDGQ